MNLAITHANFAAQKSPEICRIAQAAISNILKNKRMQFSLLTGSSDLHFQMSGTPLLTYCKAR